MGITKHDADLVISTLSDHFGTIAGLTMMELGNQWMRDLAIKERLAKEFFTNKGLKHTSVDINGKDGAIPMDLCDAKNFLPWKNKFNVVTNFGTAEHVGRTLLEQRVCFEIIHLCTNPNGIMIHVVPDIINEDPTRFYHRHGYWRYTKEFFDYLSQKNGYDVIINECRKDLHIAFLIKRQDTLFTCSVEEMEFLIISSNKKKKDSIERNVEKEISRLTGRH